jgi:hypothetical protein
VIDSTIERSKPANGNLSLKIPSHGLVFPWGPLGNIIAAEKFPYQDLGGPPPARSAPHPRVNRWGKTPSTWAKRNRP